MSELDLETRLSSHCKIVKISTIDFLSIDIVANDLYKVSRPEGSFVITTRPFTLTPFSHIGRAGRCSGCGRVRAVRLINRNRASL